MTQETIVAAFDTAAQAQAAAQDVQAAGIPAANIALHADTSIEAPNAPAFGTVTNTTTQKEPGFWAKLFGMDDDHATANFSDHTVYDRTLAGGGSVLTVKIANVETDGDRILQIIESHNPIDIEERASSYTDTTGVTAPAAVAGTDQEKIQLAEEALVVGKRIINRGTTRIRRYVTETPVSEDVSLHSETVSVARRAVTGEGSVAADAFTDRTIEMTEMDEEAVVGKTARVVEEVVIRKDATDRVETIHDTVRREEVEVEKVVDDLATNRKPLV